MPETPHADTKLEKALMFATVVFAALGGWYKLNESVERDKGRMR